MKYIGLLFNLLKVVLEKDKWPDEPDEKAIWRAYVPMLEHRGAATWGHTQQETLKNIKEVVYQCH